MESYLDNEENLHLEFSSIDAASGVFNHLKSNRSPWRDLLVKWERDDCAGDIEELSEQQVGERKKEIPEERLNGLPRGADKGRESGMNDPGFVFGMKARAVGEVREKSSRTDVDVEEKIQKGFEVSSDSDGSSLKLEYDGIEKLEEDDQHQEPDTRLASSSTVINHTTSTTVTPPTINTNHPESQDLQLDNLTVPPNSPHIPLHAPEPSTDIATQAIQRITEIDNKNLSSGGMGGLAGSRYASPSPSSLPLHSTSASLPTGMRLGSFGPSPDKVREEIDIGEEMRRRMEVSRGVPMVDLGALVGEDSDDEGKDKVGAGGNPDEILLEYGDEDEEEYDGGDEIEDMEELAGRERLLSVGI